MTQQLFGLTLLEKSFREKKEVNTTRDDGQVTMELQLAMKMFIKEQKRSLKSLILWRNNSLPLSKYKHISDMEEIHGVDMGESYRNDIFQTWKRCTE